MSNITPVAGKIHLLIGAVPIKGVTEAPWTDSTETEEITNDCDTAKRRAPMLDDGTLSFTYIYDGAGDPGQAAVRAAKTNHTLSTFTRYVSGTTGPNVTCSGYVQEISPVDSKPGPNIKYKVTIAVSNGVAWHDS